MHFMHLTACPTSADLVFFIPHCFYVLIFKFIAKMNYEVVRHTLHYMVLLYVLILWPKATLIFENKLCVILVRRQFLFLFIYFLGGVSLIKWGTGRHLAPIFNKINMGDISFFNVTTMSPLYVDIFNSSRPCIGQLCWTTAPSAGHHAAFQEQASNSTWIPF